MSKSATPRIFVTLAAPTLAAMEEQATSAAGVHLGYELRLDYLQNWSGFEPELHQMLVRLRAPLAIATCRRAEAGGLFAGSVAEQLDRLEAAVRAGCHRADLEIQSIDRAGAAILDRLRPARVIVSHHDYRQTPPLGAIYRRLARLPVAFFKIATHARTLQDNLRFAALLRAHRAGGRLVAHGLGPSGLPSRLMALKWGSAFTYGSAGQHLAVASGQLPAQVMRSVYRVDRLDARTQIYGVVGSRASISLSPAMQNSALHAKHVNAIYLPCETSKLDDFLALARRLNFSGFSVTMPYKTAIIRKLDWVEPLAAEIQACNTVAVQRGKWTGWNTDAAAVVDVLAKRLRLAGSRVLVLGAGGAARAAAYALRAEGAEVFISARRESAARRLARGISARVIPWGGTDGLDVDIVINATPVGMSPQVDALPTDLARLRTRVVFDMVYHPFETRLLADARRRGLTAISGLEMLVAQGARQFEIWTGQSAPRALMEQAVLQALGHPAERE
ncbi:MAG TPA: shikimate dehydrogenase [Terriglobia bacterium]|nr:shikimate dehydrogenase [Terriglobia bacterium]